MQLIFKYDVDRLISYSVNSFNNIKIEHDTSFTMLSFPEVHYFNYAFHYKDQPFSEDDLTKIKEFYCSENIKNFKVIAESGCKISNSLLKNDASFKNVATIVKTAINQQSSFKAQPLVDLKFIKADSSNIIYFTDLYLKGFESQNINSKTVHENFKSLLNLENLDLYILEYNETYVGITVLYKTATENLLAGGTILPEFRNNGFHQSALAFRIHQSLNNKDLENIVGWAYKSSISLKNMLKLQMQPQEEFYIYEYCT